MLVQPILVPILTFVAVVCLGGAVALLRSRRQLITSRLNPEGAIALDGGGMGLVRAIGSLTPGSAALKEQLAQAGFHSGSAVSIYLGAKLILLAVALSVGVGVTLLLDLSLVNEVLIAAVFACTVFFLPNYYVARRRRLRRAEIQRQLPGAIDLVEICVGSGMGLDMAWNMVTDEIRHMSATLADEMVLTVLEMHLGASRAEALRHMATRTGAQELAALVALLVQSDRFGTSVSDALRTFAESMRSARTFRAEETAEKTAVKLLFPLVLLIFPVMLIVMAGPACIMLYKHMVS